MCVNILKKTYLNILYSNVITYFSKYTNCHVDYAIHKLHNVCFINIQSTYYIGWLDRETTPSMSIEEFIEKLPSADEFKVYLLHNLISL